MAKATAKKEPVKSAKNWEIDEENVVTVTENNETTTVATLTWPEDDAEQTGPCSINYADEEAKRRYGQGLLVFLADEKIPFNHEAVSTGETTLADRVKAENTPEFNAKVGAPPRQDIYRGDKTPKYVEWLKKNKPATYEEKYGIVGIGSVTKTREVINPTNGRPMSEQYTVPGVTLARRKTHLTEKVEAGVIDQEEEDRNPFLKE